MLLIQMFQQATSKGMTPQNVLDAKEGTGETVSIVKSQHKSPFVDENISANGLFYFLRFKSFVKKMLKPQLNEM